MTDSRKITLLVAVIRAIEKHKLLIGFLSALVIVSFLFAGSFQKQKRADRRQVSMKTQDESRKTFAQADFTSVKTTNAKASIPSARPVKKTRNYSSDIAVFLYEENKRKEETDSHSSSKLTLKLNIPSGTKIPAFIKDTIFSFNVAAPVTAVVTDDFKIDGHIVIPKDSKFLGEAGVLKSLSRINVHFELLIFPDGTEHRVRAIALSEDGSAGIKGRVSKNTDMRVLKAVGETALAGVSLFAGGINRDPYSLEDTLRLNLAQNLTGQARQDLRNVKVETSVTVDGFTPIQVILLDGI